DPVDCILTARSPPAYSPPPEVSSCLSTPARSPAPPRIPWPPRLQRQRRCMEPSRRDQRQPAERAPLGESRISTNQRDFARLSLFIYKREPPARDFTPPQGIAGASCQALTSRSCASPSSPTTTPTRSRSRVSVITAPSCARV